MGSKKKVGKGRLDKFYHLSKETGYRSRAAFKLIQLNRKYDFLSNANVLVDLCAAPGGWLQVAEKYMPMSSIKIGVDLDPIKSIPGVKSYICDITTPKCAAIIKREIKGMKVDVVLNDGAPNVGANWAKDAYQQNELVLHSLKLACDILRRGGWFITKVFRSTDYQSLIWTFQKLFEKVSATKPEASRNSSAEIFVVCQNFKAPEFIDEKFFDIKYVFKDTENTIAQDILGQINSVDKLMKKGKNRQGYADDVPQSMFMNMSFTDFLNCENPYAIFAEYSSISLSQEEKDQYLTNIKVPEDLEQNIKDLRTLGKREVMSIIKLRNKVQLSLKKKNPKIQEKQESQDTDQELENELQNTIHKKIKTVKKEKERLLVKVAKQQVSGNNDDNNIALGDEEELFSMSRHKIIKQIGYVDIEGDEEFDRQKYLEENPRPLRNRHQYKKVDQDEMEKNIEHLYDLKMKRKVIQLLKEININKEKQALDKKEAKKNKDMNLNLPNFNIECDPMEEEKIENQEQQILTKLDLTVDQTEQKKIKQILNKQNFDNSLFEDIAKEEQFQIRNPLKKQSKIQNKQFDLEEEEPLPKKQIKKEKLNNKDDESEWSDDDKFKIEKKQSAMEKRRKVLERSRKRKEAKENTDNKIEFVPENQMELEDYDPDDLATNLVLAKKMLRKRNRESIIDSTYNKYAYNSEDEELPDWFKDDERKHCFSILPITKEEVEEEKRRIYLDQNRDSKKVIEARWRKKQKIGRKMKKIKQKSEAIFDQDGINERQKLRQVQSLVKKTLKDKEKKKQYVVGKKFKATSFGKNSRTHKLVDSRLRKDIKGEKKAQERNLGARKSKRMQRKRKSRN